MAYHIPPMFGCKCSCSASKEGHCTVLLSPVKAKDGHEMLMEECPFYKERTKPFKPKTGKEVYQHAPRVDHGIAKKSKPDKFI